MFDSNNKILPALIYKNSSLNLFNYNVDVKVRSFCSSSEEFFNKLIDEQLMETAESSKNNLKKSTDGNESTDSETSEKRFISCAYLQPKYEVKNYTDSVMIIPGQSRNIYKTAVNIIRKYKYMKEPVIEISDDQTAKNITWTSTATIQIS